MVNISRVKKVKKEESEKKKDQRSKKKEIRKRLICKTMKKDIINILKEILFSRNEIIAAFIYGSFLYTEDYNDIDVGVFTNCTFQGLEKSDYEFELEQLLSKKLTSCIIDLRVLDDAPEKFLYNVFRGCYLFSKDEKIEKIMEQIIQRSLDQQYYQTQYIQQAYGV